MSRLDEASIGKIDWGRRLADAQVQGELMDVETFLTMMAWNRADLDRAISRSRVFLLKFECREYVPKFLCDEGLARLHVQLISAALRQVSPGGKWQFFVTKKGSLGGVTPLVALAQGHLRAVRRTALGHVER